MILSFRSKEIATETIWRVSKVKWVEAVKDIMEKNGVRQVTLRKRLGLESNTMAMRLSMENISIVKLNEMLRALDYKMVIMPGDARGNSEWYELD